MDVAAFAVLAAADHSYDTAGGLIDLRLETLKQTQEVYMLIKQLSGSITKCKDC